MKVANQVGEYLRPVPDGMEQSSCTDQREMPFRMPMRIKAKIGERQNGIRLISDNNHIYFFSGRKLGQNMRHGRCKEFSKQSRQVQRIPAKKINSLLIIPFCFEDVLMELVEVLQEQKKSKL
jgi:propanediol utilization protein